MKNNKGITLVALVVTIIVLIILAGISINLILGDNGIITIAKRAKENIELAKIEEETELNELYTQLESSGTNSGGNNYDAIAKLTEFKKAIANAIDEAGGLRPDSSAETTIFVNNIKGILKEVTKNATATAEDIKEGKTAWVNGEMVLGTNKTNEIATIVNQKLTCSATYSSTSKDYNYYFAVNGAKSISNLKLQTPANAGSNNYIIIYGYNNTEITSSTQIDKITNNSGGKTVEASPIDISNYDTIRINIHVTHSGNSSHSSTAKHYINIETSLFDISNIN